jgi:hypothetical protein
MVAPPAHVDATSASISQTGRLIVSHRVDTGLQQSSTSLEFHGPTAFPDPSALLLHFPYEKRPRNLAGFPESAVLRVWLPSRRCKPSQILGDVFQPPTLLGFALQSFSPSQWSIGSFVPIFPLLRFSTKPVGASHRRFSGVLPPRKPCPLYCSPED